MSSRIYGRLRLWHGSITWFLRPQTLSIHIVMMTKVFCPALPYSKNIHGLLCIHNYTASFKLPLVITSDSSISTHSERQHGRPPLFPDMLPMRHRPEPMSLQSRWSDFRYFLPLLISITRIFSLIVDRILWMRYCGCMSPSTTRQLVRTNEV